jgi:hypothetical protein
MRLPDDSTVRLARGALQHLPAEVISDDDIQAFDLIVSTSRTIRTGGLADRSAIQPPDAAILTTVLLAAGYAREILVQIAAESGAGALRRAIRRVRRRRRRPAPLPTNWTSEQLRQVHDSVAKKLHTAHGLSPESASIIADGIVAELAMVRDPVH